MNLQALSHTVRVASGAAALLLIASVHAEPRKNPASKFYVSDVSGEAQIDTGDKVEDLSKRSVYTAQGTVIETKKADSDRAKAYSTMVYSNGTGAFFDADTRVEVKQFVQEPFVPNRSDIETEPSISQTQAFIARGGVGLCNSKLVAGSSMVYNTAHGSVNVRGRKVVIETDSNATRISMLEGESTVRAGSMDMGGHILRSGEQAIIHRAAPGQPNQIEIQKIPAAEASRLDDKVAMACMAKRTVYFEERERRSDSSSSEPVGDAGDNSGAGGGGSGSSAGGRVTAFDGSNSSTSATGGGGGVTREIVPVEIVPSTLPTQFTVSPATIASPSSGPGR